LKIYMMTDMEGVCGVVSHDEWVTPEGRYYEEGKRLLTLEVNAAVEGFIEAGGSEFLVIDGHGYGGIQPELLHPEVQYCRGPWPGPYPFMLDESFDAMVWIGQHAKAGTEYAHMAHTGWFDVKDSTINGISVGEFGQMALVGAELGVRSIFAAGDQAFAAEAVSLVSGIETVAVKRGIMPGSGAELDTETYKERNNGAVHLHPSLARERIREGAARALRRFRENRELFELLKLPPPYRYEVHIRGEESQPAHKRVAEHPDSMVKLLNAPLRMIKALDGEHSECGRWNMYKPSSYEDMKKLLVKDGARVVITGDSLSYNRYDFDPEPRTNAYDCLPGIGSWSFLLRDAIHRQDPWFQHGDELKLICQDARTTILASQMPPYVFPYQNRNISAVVENGEEEVSFLLDTGNGGRPAITQAVLHFGRVPQDHAAQFDIYVDGQYQATVDNGGSGKKFQGYEPFTVVLPLAPAESVHRITFTNWRSSPLLAAARSSGTYIFHLLAVGSRLIDVHLTGQGSRTADWLLENIEERVTFCRPDAVILIIGANDRVYRTTEQFERDLKRLIAEIRAVNQEAQLLFLSPPYASDDGSGDKYARYHRILQEVTQQQQCLFFDLIDFFAEVPIADWRYDNVHFTQYGNRLLADALIKRLLPAGILNEK